MKTIISEKERWEKAAVEYSKKVENKESQGFLIREKCLNPYLFESLGNVSGKKILDYGCGDGWLAGELKQKGAKVKGGDISKKFIDIAKQKNPGIEFKVIDETTLFNDNEFDIVVCNIVLHITKNYKQVLNEIYRITKPNGRAIITIMHPSYYKAEIADFSKKEEKLKIKVEETVPVIYYRRAPEIYEEAFDKTGFMIIKKQECIAKEVISPELKKYSEKPFFLLYELKKWIKYAASAIIYDNKGNVLIAKRSPTKFPFPNVWSLPSTSFKEGKDPQKVLRNALIRKLGIETKIGRIIGTKEGKQANYWLKMADYEVKIIKGTPVPNKKDYTGAKYLDIEKICRNKPKEKKGFCVQVLFEHLSKK